MSSSSHVPVVLFQDSQINSWNSHPKNDQTWYQQSWRFQFNCFLRAHRNVNKTYSSTSSLSISSFTKPVCLDYPKSSPTHPCPSLNPSQKRERSPNLPNLHHPQPPSAKTLAPSIPVHRSTAHRRSPRQRSRDNPLGRSRVGTSCCRFEESRSTWGDGFDGWDGMGQKNDPIL